MSNRTLLFGENGEDRDIFPYLSILEPGGMCYLCPFLDMALSKMVQRVGIREEGTAKRSINLPFLGRARLSQRHMEQRVLRSDYIWSKQDVLSLNLSVNVTGRWEGCSDEAFETHSHF